MTYLEYSKPTVDYTQLEGKDTDGWAKVIANIEKQPTYEAIHRYFIKEITAGTAGIACLT